MQDRFSAHRRRSLHISNLKEVTHLAMKKLSNVLIWSMLVILSAGQAFALPGVYRAGAPTMDLYVGECETRTISMDGTGWGTSPLVSGDFLICSRTLVQRLISLPVSAMTEL